MPLPSRPGSGGHSWSSPLPNSRHEAFAQALAKGAAADAAYRAAGYRQDRGNAARLKANDSIRQRVADITARAATRAEVTRADVLRALMHEAGMTGERPDDSTSSARIQALRLLGLELGMFTGRRTHDVADRMADLIQGARPLPIGAKPPPHPHRPCHDNATATATFSGSARRSRSGRT